MKTFYTDNAALAELLENHGISLICDENMQIVISDEDAARIPGIVAEFAPAAIDDYTIEETLKASYKMRKAIERYEKKVGVTMHKEFFVEHMPENRVGHGFYDGCQLSCDHVPALNRIVNHDGEIF